MKLWNSEKMQPYCSPRFPFLSFAKNASAGIALCCNAFITVMQASEVRNLDDPSDTRDLPRMWKSVGEIQRRQRLGGMLNYYYRAAA